MEATRALAEQELYLEWAAENPIPELGLRLSRTARTLHSWLTYMATRYRTGAVYPKQANLAQLLGVGVEAVRRATRRLEQLGLVDTRWQEPPSSWTRNRHWRRVYMVKRGGAEHPARRRKTVGVKPAPKGIGRNVGTTSGGASSISTRGGDSAEPPKERAKPIHRDTLHRVAGMWSDWHQEYMGHKAHAGPRDYGALKQTLQHHEPEFVLRVMRGILAHKALHALWEGMKGAVPLHRFLYHFGAYATHWEYLRDVVEPHRWDAGSTVNEAGQLVPHGLYVLCMERNRKQQTPPGLARWLQEIREKVPIRYFESLADPESMLLPGLRDLLVDVIRAREAVRGEENQP